MLRVRIPRRIRRFASGSSALSVPIWAYNQKATGLIGGKVGRAGRSLLARWGLTTLSFEYSTFGFGR